MSRILQRMKSLLLFTLAAAVLLLPLQSQAAEYSCTVSIPVEVRTEGEDVPIDSRYIIVWEAADSSTPAPLNGRAEFKGTGSIYLGPVTFTSPGDYRYTIRQEAAGQENFTYDNTVYTVTVRVLNDENGGLRSEIWAIRDNAQNKADQIVFVNQYDKPSSNTDTGGGSDPGSGTTSNPKPQETQPSTPATQGAALFTGTAPRTGDTGYTLFWGILMVLSLGVAAVIFCRRRKREE